MKNKRTGISVQTLPNGYSLDVDGVKYLYYLKLDFVKGIFAHFALDIKNELDKDCVEVLIHACATWPKEGDAILAAIKLRDENEQLRQRISNMQRDLRDIKDRVARQNDEIAKLQGGKQKSSKPQDCQPKKIVNPLLRTSAKRAILAAGNKGRRAKADAAVLAELERQAEERTQQQ